MTKRDKPPLPMVTLTARGFVPVSAYDAELLDSMPTGTEFDLVRHSKRSWPQLKTYWVALDKAVKATGIAPDKTHLSDDLKMALGYTKKSKNHTTQVISLVPDSIAFDNMDHAAFMVFFNAAMAQLAEWVGYDPLRFMEEPT